MFLERWIMQIENKWVNLKWVWAWNGHGQLKVGEQINLKWGLPSTCMGLGFISRWVNKTWGLLSTHMGLGSNSSPHPQLTATLNEPHVAHNALTSPFFHAQSRTVDWMEGVSKSPSFFFPIINLKIFTQKS